MTKADLDELNRRRESREAFALMAQEQETEQRFHERLVAEVQNHPERTMGENLKAAGFDQLELLL
jgi:acyl CoA:acetate/3-ketoacid CoA transferase alpha subunit